MKKKSKSGKTKSKNGINWRPRFSEARLTIRAGLIPMGRFMDKLGIGVGNNGSAEALNLLRAIEYCISDPEVLTTVEDLLAAIDMMKFEVGETDIRARSP
ncbi:MAG: hypothetical protein AB1646_11520 [Thermodesulfobacteriota bacterium]